MTMIISFLLIKQTDWSQIDQEIFYIDISSIFGNKMKVIKTSHRLSTFKFWNQFLSLNHLLSYLNHSMHFNPMFAKNSVL